MDEFPELPGYVIERELSRTLMSVVYLARQPKLNNRLVAIKVLARKHADNPEYRARFQREVDASATLNHPNIVPVLDAPAGQALLYLVMPFIDGWSLSDELASHGVLEPARIVHIVREVATALDYAHRSGVVHRDVKPGNIMLHRHSDHAYLLDFGISARLEGERMTEVGRDVGTPGYLAPELVSDFSADRNPVTRQADVFSLGVVAYRCLTGRLPHDHLDTGGARWEQLSGTPPVPVSTLRPGLPAAVDHAVARALGGPAQRYATCTELAVALASSLAGPTIHDEPTLPPAAAPRRPSRLGAYRTPLLVGAVAIALIVAFVVIWVPLRNGSGGPDLSRVPPTLIGDCASATGTAGFPDAESVLVCRDGEREVRFGLYADPSTVDSAYADALAEAGIPRGSGDCTRSTGAEHRYPGDGPQTGRVVCHTGAGTTTMVWTDDERRTLARADARSSDDASLTAAWARWVGIPAFPTDEEQSLIDLVEKPRCRRAEAGTLDSFRDLTAAIECDANSRLAATVTFYRFADLDALRRTYDGHVDEVNPPSGTPCYDNPPGFLGNRRYDLRSVDVGAMLCYLGERGTPTLEWTVEPMLVLSRATGPDPAELAEWWSLTSGIPQERVVESINARSEPPFPTDAERDLLDHVPAASRNLCLRPSPGQVRDNAGDARVVAVACGPTSGAGAVYYYQFEDVASMNASYVADLDVSGPDCAANPPNFTGDAPYERAGATGRLGCEQRDGDPFLSWTHSRLRIAAFAYHGAAPEAFIEWWRTEAGPV